MKNTRGKKFPCNHGTQALLKNFISRSSKYYKKTNVKTVFILVMSTGVPCFVTLIIR